jgi:hypothetical protein
MKLGALRIRVGMEARGRINTHSLATGLDLALDLNAE